MIKVISFLCELFILISKLTICYQKGAQFHCDVFIGKPKANLCALTILLQ